MEKSQKIRKYQCLVDDINGLTQECDKVKVYRVSGKTLGRLAQSMDIIYDEALEEILDRFYFGYKFRKDAFLEHFKDGYFMYLKN